MRVGDAGRIQSTGGCALSLRDRAFSRDKSVDLFRDCGAFVTDFPARSRYAGV
jgi:hypothetical protein